MQGIYNYIPETNHVSRVYSFAATLCLQFMLHVMFVLWCFVVDLIWLLSIYLLGDFCVSKTVGGIMLSQERKFILSSKIKGHVLGICVLYDTFLKVLLFASFLNVFGYTCIL